MSAVLFWFFSTMIFTITLGLTFLMFGALIGWLDSNEREETFYFSRVRWLALRVPVLIALSVALLVGINSVDNQTIMAIGSAVGFLAIFSWGKFGDKFPEKNNWINKEVEKIVKQRMTQEMQKLLGRVGAYQTRPEYEPYQPKNPLHELEEFLKQRISGNYN